jgi:hypothetical protein
MLALHTSEAGQQTSSKAFGYLLNMGASYKLFAILYVARLLLG